MGIVIPFPGPIIDGKFTTWPKNFRPPGSGLTNMAGGVSAQIRGEWVWFREDHQAEIILLCGNDDESE